MKPMRRLLVIATATVAACAPAADEAETPASPEIPAEGRIVEVERLPLPDSVPLTFVRQISADPSGRLAVIDAVTPSVLLVAADGSFAGRLGREGRGPGEFQAIFRAGLHDRTIWVTDAGNGRATLFQPEANPVPPPEALPSSVPFAVLRDGSVLYVAEFADRVDVDHLASDGTVSRVTQIDWSDRNWHVTEDGSTSLAQPLGSSPIVSTWPEGLVIVDPDPDGDGAAYRVTWWSPPRSAVPAAR